MTELAVEHSGTRIVLARASEDLAGFASCAHPGCGVQIQRTVRGDLLDGVRAHYRTVHPDRRIR